jgi:hypothetical protein
MSDTHGNLKGILTLSPSGFPVETFLRCDVDGRIVVKDGRSLEEYINDPRIVAKRKGRANAPTPMILLTESAALFGLVGGVA